MFRNLCLYRIDCAGILSAELELNHLVILQSGYSEKHMAYAIVRDVSGGRSDISKEKSDERKKEMRQKIKGMIGIKSLVQIKQWIPNPAKHQSISNSILEDLKRRSMISSHGSAQSSHNKGSGSGQANNGDDIDGDHEGLLQSQSCGAKTDAGFQNNGAGGAGLVPFDTKTTDIVKSKESKEDVNQYQYINPGSSYKLENGAIIEIPNENKTTLYLFDKEKLVRDYSLKDITYRFKFSSVYFNMFFVWF